MSEHRTERPFIDYGDLLIMLGTVLVVGGLYLFDVRLAIIGGGLYLQIFGGLRLRSVK